MPEAPQPCKCSSEEWVEEKVIRPAAAPSQDARLMTTPKAVRYRLRCAGCGKIHPAYQTESEKKRNVPQKA